MILYKSKKFVYYIYVCYNFHNSWFRLLFKTEKQKSILNTTTPIHPSFHLTPILNTTTPTHHSLSLLHTQLLFLTPPPPLIHPVVHSTPILKTSTHRLIQSSVIHYNLVYRSNLLICPMYVWMFVEIPLFMTFSSRPVSRL